MAKVICKLPNASALISGVKFVTHKLGMISEEIADEVAAEFVKIEGYVLAEVEKITGGKGSKGGKESAAAGSETTPADPAAGGSDAGKQ
jgi:hypothetical protein